MKKHPMIKWSIQSMLFLLICSALFFATGCTTNTKTAVSAPPLELADVDELSHNHTDIIPLSFYTSDGEALAIEYRVVEIEQNADRGVIALQALLAGPESSDENLQALFVETTNEWTVQVDKVQVSENIANVYLYNESGGSNDEASLIKARTAIANTLIDYLKVDYVAIYFNQEAVNYQDVPLGAMGRYDGNPNDYVAQIRRQAENGIFPLEVVAVLYFPDATNSALFCESRSLLFESEADFLPDALSQIILNELLLKGPRNTALMSNLIQTPSSSSLPYAVEVSHSLILAGNQTTSNDEGDDTEENTQEQVVAGTPLMEKTLSINVLGNSSNQALAETAIRQSIKSLLTDAALHQIEINFSKVSNIDLTLDIKSDINNKQSTTDENNVSEIVTTVPLYFPNKTSGLLQVYMANINCEQRENPMFIMKKLYNGPSNDNFLAEIFPQGSGEGEIINAYISNKTVVVDLAESLVVRLEQEDVTMQKQFLYSIISTMVQLPTIDSVQFLVEGEVRDSIGQYVIAQPLMPDWGYVL